MTGEAEAGWITRKSEDEEDDDNPNGRAITEERPWKSDDYGRATRASGNDDAET